MQYKTLKVGTEDRVATVSLNRPEVRNAFHPEMIQELTDAFRAFAARRDVAVIVLKGEGKSFCAGADLGWMKSMVDFTLEENRADSHKLHAMFEAIQDCPVPVIGRLHGHVMGGATGLAAVCDVAAAETGTQFCFSEVRLGLVPAVISPFVIAKMARARAQRYMLTAEVFGEAEAVESGLIHFAGSAAEVDAFVARCVKAVLGNGPEAVRATKALLNTVAAAVDPRAVRDETTRVIAERRVSSEGQEGLRGFLEKREPSWRVGSK